MIARNSVIYLWDGDKTVILWIFSGSLQVIFDILDVSVFSWFAYRYWTAAREIRKSGKMISYERGSEVSFDKIEMHEEKQDTREEILVTERKTEIENDEAYKHRWVFMLPVITITIVMITWFIANIIDHKVYNCSEKCDI